MLCDVELPPTAPHPNVKAGTKLIVAPIPPRAPGEFTTILETGISNANLLTSSSLFACIQNVCPAPSFSNISLHLFNTASTFSSTKKVKIVVNFSLENGYLCPTWHSLGTKTLAQDGIPSKPANLAMSCGVFPTICGFIVPFALITNLDS